MKKATCTTFVNVLDTIHQEGITTKAALMADQQLYAEFWFALSDFCAFALRSKNGGKNSEGEARLGNIGKIDVLESLGVTTRDEIEADCAIKIIDKLDLVLQQPLEKQKNYCYTICNNTVNDCFRKLPPDNFKIVPLYKTIAGTRVATEDAYTYEDIIADDTYNPERLHVEQETIEELRKKLKAKQAEEIAEKKNVILHEIASLCARGPEVFVRLACKHLGLKTNELAARIIAEGYENTFAQTIIDVANKYNIDLADIREVISVRLTEESYKKDKGLFRLLSGDSKVVADQISKYASRAKGRLTN